MEAQVINRNNVDAKFIEREKKKGTAKGEKYLGIDYASLAYEGELTLTPAQKALFQFVGVDEVEAIVKGKIDARSQGWTDEATADDDTFSVEEWRQCALGLSQRGETMADLKQKLDELEDQALDPNLPDDQAIALLKKIRETKTAINSKKRERAPKTEEAAPTVKA